MNRLFVFGIAMFFAVVGIALLGGEREALAGRKCHGCNGCSCDCSCYSNCGHNSCCCNPCYNHCGCGGCGGCHAVHYHCGYNGHCGGGVVVGGHVEGHVVPAPAPAPAPAPMNGGQGGQGGEDAAPAPAPAPAPEQDTSIRGPMVYRQVSFRR